MRLALVFLAVFIVGPLVFRLLTRRPPSRQGQLALICFTVLMGAGGLLIRFELGADWGQRPLPTLWGILMSWFGWIGVLAFGAQALRQADPRPAMRRWTGMLGAVGTTIPWFGLASARWMAG